MAKLGRSGKHKQNIERDLHAWLRKNSFNPVDLDWIWVPMRAERKKKTVEWVWHPVIWPFNLARAAWEAGEGQFKTSFLRFGGNDGLRKFWERGRQCAWATTSGQLHPGFADERTWHVQVPYLTHGDKARTQRRLSKPQQLLNLAWQSGTTRGCSWDTRFIFTVMPAERLITWGPFEDRTIHHLLEHMALGLNQMETGVMPVAPIAKSPRADFAKGSLNDKWRGQRVAGGYEFRFVGSKGDLEFHQMAYPSPHGYHTHANYVCNKCWASAIVPGLEYTNTKPDALHKRTMMSTADYLSNLEYHSPLTKLPGWGIVFLLWDLMHNLHCGAGKDQVASGVVLLCSVGWFGGTTIEEQLEDATDVCKRWWSAKGVHLQIKNFTKTSVHYYPQTQYPIYESKAYCIKLCLIWLPGRCNPNF